MTDANRMVGVLIACVFVLGVVGTEGVDPLVETEQGLIKGIRSEVGDFSMFLGIPFGKVDDNNPFGVATPYPKFEKTFLANDDSARCPQVEEFNHTIVGSLDCLRLNVYVPNVASSKNKLPVMVWIYGGGFQFGTASRYLYGPNFLVRHDIVLVTVNYRVGIYGFMCIDTPEVPGNQGLKDQLLGLRWVRDNIASFGGDPDRVTLAGESAGGASVDLHLWSKQEKLFNNVIIQSGSILSPWVFADKDFTQPIRLAERLGYVTDDPSDAVSFLAKTDVKLVIGAVSELSMVFVACVEKEFENVESMVSEHPRNSNVPKARDIKILTGFNDKELMFDYMNKPDSYFDNLNVFNLALYSLFKYDEEFSEMEDVLRHFYIGDENISQDVRWDLVDFGSDLLFIYPMHESIQKFLENDANVYHYVFSYSGERNMFKKKLNIKEEGAAHADEITYLFDTQLDPSTPTAEDQHIVDVITTLWTNFVKYGNPTPEATDLIPTRWVPVTKNSSNYLNIDTELTMGRGLYNKRMAFWKLFLKLYQNKIRGYDPKKSKTRNNRASIDLMGTCDEESLTCDNIDP